MSMIGFAASPGTVVEPMCSIWGARGSERGLDPAPVRQINVQPPVVVAVEVDLEFLGSAD